jgi:hypothetical protein
VQSVIASYRHPQTGEVIKKQYTNPTAGFAKMVELTEGAGGLVTLDEATYLLFSKGNNEEWASWFDFHQRYGTTIVVERQGGAVEVLCGKWDYDFAPRWSKDSPSPSVETRQAQSGGPDPSGGVLRNRTRPPAAQKRGAILKDA